MEVTSVTSFLPSTHGFRFANRWPRGTPLLRLPGPLPITLGDANSGLCGGMALAAADLFRTGQAPAPWTSPPGPGTPAFAYLRARLIASWDLPWGAATFAGWSMAPDGDTIFGLSGVGRRTIGELPKLRAAVDTTGLALLGLVTVRTFNPAELLGRNHIVLAYAYRARPTSTTVRVYDPNSPRRDTVHITIDTATGGGPARITHDVGIARPIRGLFVLPAPTGDPAPVAA